MSAPTPTCPGDSTYDPAFMQCAVKDAFGFPVPRGVPTCPSGYMYWFPNTCVAIPAALDSAAPTPTCPAGSVFTHYMQQAGGLCSAGGLSLGSPRCPAGFVWKPAEATAENRTNTAANIGSCVEDPAIAAAQQQAAAEAAATSAQTAVDKYTTSFQGIQTQKNQLQQTLDLMASAKGLYLSLIHI